MRWAVILAGGVGSRFWPISPAPRPHNPFLQFPPRVDTPAGLSGLVEEIGSPAYAATVGLILYGAGKKNEYGGNKKSALDQLTKKLPFKGFLDRAIEFVKSFLP